MDYEIGIEEEKTPEILYRAINLTVDDFLNYDPSLPLRPGTEVIDVEGNKTVVDGNEYGVYMSSNPNMVKSAYYKGSRDSVKTEQFSMNRPEYGISLPSVGIFFEINTRDLAVRIPKIAPNLQGLYNNGWVGNEYIANEIPPSNFKIRELSLSTSKVNYKEAKIYPINSEKDYITAREDISKIYRDLKSKAEKFRDVISKLTINERMNATKMSKLYDEIFGNS